MYESDDLGSKNDDDYSEYYTESEVDRSGGDSQFDTEYYSETEYTDEYTEYTEDEYGSESQRDDGHYHRHYGNGHDSSSMRSDPSYYETDEKRASQSRLPAINRSHTSPHVASHKTITVYRNGDAHFPGRTVIIGPMFRSFDYLLDWITTRIKSPFGAVRKLYLLPTGKVMKSLDDIQDGCSYVAARQEKLQRLQYSQILDYSTRQRTYMAPDLDKFKYRQREVKGRNAVEHPITLFCLANRDKDGVTTKIILRNRDRTSMSHVLDIITERLGYRKLPAVAKLLIDMETRATVTKLSQLQNGHFYVAIDRPDQIVMPPFRIDPETREVIPVVQPTKRKVKNMPIMFDGPIRGKIDCGERIVEKREAKGFQSKVGKVTLRQRRVPKELPPIKQPFPKQLHIMQASESWLDHQGPITLKKTPHDRAIWRIIHSYVDELTTPLVEETLKEMHDTIYQLLNNLVVLRTTAPGHQSLTGAQQASPEPPRTVVIQREPTAATLAGRSARFGERNTMFDDCVDEFMDYMGHPQPDVFNHAVTDADIALRDRFRDAMNAALNGELMHWRDNPKKFVTLIVLLDQIPRKFFPGMPEMYDGDGLSKELINSALEKHTDVLTRIKPAHMLFVCVALSHQEDLESQRTARRIWGDVRATFPSSDAEHAERSFTSNFKTIEKFGRFPQRNKVLNRESTHEETVYLSGGDSSGVKVGVQDTAKKIKKKNGKAEEGTKPRRSIVRMFRGKRISEKRTNGQQVERSQS